MMNFHRGFDSSEWVRGQEGDSYWTTPHGNDLDAYVGHPSVREQTDQYLRNVSTRDDTDEEAYFAARVAKRGMNWLESNRDTEKFFLWIDSFDPHEPWNPPPAYREKHIDPNYDGSDLILPRIGSSEGMSQGELEHVRGLYAATVEYASHWAGKILEKLKKLDLYKPTLTVFLSDHGAVLGEHGYMRKSGGDLHSELLDIPVFVKPPADMCEIQAFVDTVEGLVRLEDLPATLFEMVGLKRGLTTVHGRSLLPLMRGDRESIRDTVVIGYHDGPVRCVRDERWSFIYRPEAENELYDLESDPREQTNLIEQESKRANALAAKLERPFRVEQSPPGLNQRASDRE
jgi:arylsulfatase A-like enzyme